MRHLNFISEVKWFQVMDKFWDVALTIGELELKVIDFFFFNYLSIYLFFKEVSEPLG